jgi:hypothetical protein
MTRILMFAVLLAACVRSDDVAGVEARSSWLEGWLETRRCLVADASDVRTGLAIAMLSGLDCSKQLHRLEAHISVDDSQFARRAAARLVRTIDAESSPTRRAAAIEAMDAVAALLPRTPGSEPTRASPLPLRTLRDVIPLFAGEPVLSTRFNGGYVSATASAKRFIVRAIGEEQVIAVAPHSTLAMPSASWRVEWRDRAIAAADAGSRRIVLRRSASSAYELDVSSDGGAHWRTQFAPPTTRLLDAWQDPVTGAIQVLLGDAKDQILEQRITPQQPRPELHHAEHFTPKDMQTLRCDNAGIAWILAGDRVGRFGESLLHLGGNARMAQLDCRGDVALVLRREPDVLERCHHHCVPVFTSAVRGSSALLDDGRWIYAASIDDVVAIWLEPVGAFDPPPRPRFYRLPKVTQIVAIARVGNHPALVTSENDKYELVPLK